jgi:EAL domain-containing protein (putative c-di-GMP-specific phosphodiesterase class I)
VAEGVETTAQATLLAELDCDEAQGYLYSKAISAGQLLQQWLHGQPAATSTASSTSSTSSTSVA